MQRDIKKRFKKVPYYGEQIDAQTKLGVFDCLKQNGVLEAKDFVNNYLDGTIVNLLNDEELLLFVEQFFLNDLNINQTARNTFMHRNTILYRIAKIKRLTGLDIRRFGDASALRLLMSVATGLRYGKEKDKEDF